MEKDDRIKQYETDQVDLKGADEGELGVMTTFVFKPDPEAVKDVDERELWDIARKTLEKFLYGHCDRIGWYPDPKRKDPYELKRDKTDGSFVIMSFLKPKDASSKTDFKHRIKIDDR